MKKVKVTEVSVYHYVPDLAHSEYYEEKGVKTIEDAMALDREDVEAGTVSPEELADDLRDVTYKFEIVNVEEPDEVEMTDQERNRLFNKRLGIA